MSKAAHVTIRMRMGMWEFEVTGPRQWAEKQVRNFIRRRKAEAKRKATG